MKTEFTFISSPLSERFHLTNYSRVTCKDFTPILKITDENQKQKFTVQGYRTEWCAPATQPAVQLCKKRSRKTL